jgi:ABC-type branched-subunit amino acid transport system substrate-binding protein
MPSMVARAIVPAVVLAVVSAALLAGCAASPPASTLPPTPGPGKTVEPTGDGVLRIGDLYPATGTFAFLGAAQAAGVNLAVKEINEAGGVHGAPVEVFHADSADAASTTAESALADLLTKPVDVLVGPSSSVLVQRLAPDVVAAGVPLISPSATATGLTGLADADLIFRVVPAYGAQGGALAELLSEHGPVDVALVAYDDDDSAALLASLTAGLEAAGSALVATELFGADTKDFTTTVAAVTAAAPDAVILATPGAANEQAKTLIQALSGAGYGGPKLWLTTQNTADYSQALPAGLLTGVNGIIEGWEPDEAFRNRLKQVDPALALFRYGAESYDATIMAALAAVLAGDDGAPSIAAALAGVSRGGIKCTSYAECLTVLQTQDDIDYDGVSGPQNFDSNGDIAPAYYGVFTFNGENKFVFARGVMVG